MVRRSCRSAAARERLNRCILPAFPPVPEEQGERLGPGAGQERMSDFFSGFDTVTSISAEGIVGRGLRRLGRPGACRGNCGGDNPSYNFILAWTFTSLISVVFEASGARRGLFDSATVRGVFRSRGLGFAFSAPTDSALSFSRHALCGIEPCSFFSSADRGER